MASLSKTVKTYSLLSIGQRGVGKTVFLAGSFADLHSEVAPGQLWFDCQDSQTLKSIETLLNYITRTGKYPPPTMKITNFNFSLKQRHQEGEQTLCHFRWYDVPGETCNFDDPSFRELVFNSNGCCLFIDAEALIHKPEYRQKLDTMMQQVIPIVTLVHLNKLKYAFALLLTKCDLLEDSSATRHSLEEHLKPITTGLDTLEINYQTFYLKIPIVKSDRASTLQSTGTAQALLWLVNELEKANIEETELNRTVAKLQPQSADDEGSLGKPNRSDRRFDSTSIIRLVLALVAVAGVGVAGLFWFNSVNRNSPADSPATEQ